MLGKPKFEYGQTVTFSWTPDESLTGSIYIIDAYGTFEDDSDVSYDILVGGETGGCLYKHINEKYVTSA